MAPTLYAVIMAGGSGTRFWPASRRARPKQFLRIASEHPLLAETARRLEGLVPPERILVVTTSDQADEVRRVLPELPVLNVLAEPEARNTAPCVALACFEILGREADSVQIVLPSDHVIRPMESFQRTLLAAAEEANRSGSLLVCGIRPTWPATAFGYVEAGEKKGEVGGIPVHKVERFVEKPDLERAREFLARKTFLWNAGIFVWHTDAIARAIERFLPEVHERLSQVRRGESLAEAYRGMPSVSIDVAVLERAQNVRMLPIDYFWSDVGSWTALEEVGEKDAQDNVAGGGAELVAEGARGCIVHGDPGEILALIGVEDLVVVHSGKATLVCRKDRAQDVKGIVERLQREGREGWI